MMRLVVAAAVLVACGDASAFSTDTLGGSGGVGSKCRPQGKCRSAYRPKDKTSIVTYGDSITLGQGVTLGNEYPTLAKALYGFASLSNQGLNGNTSSDMAKTQTHLNRSQGTKAVYTILVGQNDLNTYGSSADAVAIFKDSLREQILWLAIPAAQKWMAFGAPGNTVTFAGTWVNSALYDGSQIKYSTALSSTATCSSMTAGTAVYVSMLTISGLASHTYTISVDGVVQGTYDTQPYNNFNFTTAAGVTYAPRAHRFSGLSNTTHTAVVTCVSGTTSCTPFMWCGTNSVTRDVQPTVVVGNLTQHADGTNTNVLLYKAAAEAVVAELVADGHSVALADTYNALNPATDFQADFVHPNDSGDAKLAPVFVGGIMRAP